MRAAVRPRNSAPFGAGVRLRPFPPLLYNLGWTV